MAVVHIWREEAAHDFDALIARACSGEEIIIDDVSPVVLKRASWQAGRSIAECIALLPDDSTATIDEDFAKDVAIAIDAHREPLDLPSWD